MTTTHISTSGDAAVPGYVWGRCASRENPDYWSITEEECRQRRDSYWAGLPDEPALPGEAARAEMDSPDASADGPKSAAAEELLAQFAAIRQLLAEVPARLQAVSSPDLARLTAEATATLAAVEAARAAVVLDAHSRGVIASSDNPRVDRFVEQACRDAGVPVTKKHASTLREIAETCEGHDATALREAVTTGRIGLESAAVTARFYRRIRSKITLHNWEPVLEDILGYVAAGATARDLDAAADQMIGQYGDEGALDEEHESAYIKRDVSAFRRGRDGMLTASMRLDPASEAILTSALTALSVPQPGPDGERDERTTGQRRADALLILAGAAGQFDETNPGTGNKARVMVTIDADVLADRLHDAGIDPRTGHQHDCALAAPSGPADPGAAFRASAPVGSCAADGFPAASYPGAGAADGLLGAASSTGIRTADGLPVAASSTSTRTADGLSADAASAASSADSRISHGCPALPGAPAPNGVRAASGVVCTCGTNTPRAGNRGVGVTEHGQVLTPTEVRTLACDAGIIPVVLGRKGEVLDVGRESRLVTQPLRNALIQRDGGCSFPGCTAPPSWCDAHHLIEWIRGGPTDLWNLALLCRHHHRETHSKGHIGTATKQGVIWTRTDGTPIGNTPRPERCR